MTNDNKTNTGTEIVRSEQGAPTGALLRVDTELGEDATDEEAAEFVLRWQAFRAAFKAIDAELKAKLLERLIRTNRSLEVGEIRYYAGEDRDTECTDVAAADDKLLIACKGDMKEHAACLVSQPFKVSAARQKLPPEDFASCFAVKSKPVVKEGKPQKKLLSVNPKFLK